MTRDEILYDLQNADKRSAGETLGAGLGGALAGGLKTAALPLLFNALARAQGGVGIPLKAILASAGIGAATGGINGLITGGGFGQGIDSSNASLLTLPFEYGQASNARKAKTLDNIYNKLKISNDSELNGMY